MTKLVTKKFVPFNNRPKCRTPGCTSHCQHLGTYRADGTPNFRAYCIRCHNTRRVNFQELESNVDRRKLAGCAVVGCRKKVEVFGTDKNGKLKFTVFCKDHACMVNSYLLHRKDYCENIDGRLGFVCTTNVIWDGMLDVDHIDGDPTNQDPKNLQTLCKCCHAYKTNKYKDYATPGRKALKKGMFTKLI